MLSLLVEQQSALEGKANLNGFMEKEELPLFL